MRLALHQPDIAGNVGAILRLAACMGVGVDLIEPLGFAWSDRALKRAGMDYAAAAEVTRHADWAAFERQATGRIVLLTTAGATALPAAVFRADDVLLFGSEGAGAPDAVHDRADLRIAIPMRPGLRSLNLAVSAAMALGEALRQTDGWPGGPWEMAMDVFKNRDMAGTEFNDVNLADARFINVNLAGATLEDVNLSGVSIENANIKGLTILGYDVETWLREQLAKDGRHLD